MSRYRFGANFQMQTGASRQIIAASGLMPATGSMQLVGRGGEICDYKWGFVGITPCQIHGHAGNIYLEHYFSSRLDDHFQRKDTPENGFVADLILS